MTRLWYEKSRVYLQGDLPDEIRKSGYMKWEPDARLWHAEARRYRELVLYFHQTKLPLIDDARDYAKFSLQIQKQLTPRPHQNEALKLWRDAGSQGVVSMPTGAGKTIFAVMAMAVTDRPTLVVVPTIDLLQQWQKVLTEYFGVEPGLVGGGKKEVKEITIATYDSASLMIDELGNRFGLAVFDECHHLPASQYQQIARGLIAPFRLGLSATVERPDGREELLYNLVGDLIYEVNIRQMASQVLSPYDVINIQVPLTDEEHAAYQEARKKYLNFVKRAGINFSDPRGWQDFVFKASQSPEGREALKAHRLQKKLAQGAQGKLQEVWKILLGHRDERVIIFTDDNSLAYRIGKEFILPVLTHHTKPKERKKMLELFRDGAITTLVTSKVLNEGVDVPEASVGVVVSGSGGVREHVQRLGRILRHKPGKRARLYEIVAKDTSELYVNWRRRQHHAYQRASEIHHP